MDDREVGSRAIGADALAGYRLNTVAETYAITRDFGMRVISYSDFRRNLASSMDAVAADYEPLLITRDRDKPAAVLILLKDFASCEETAHLLRSSRNAEQLSQSIAELEAGHGVERTLIE